MGTDYTYHIITTAEGQTVPAKLAPGFSVGITSGAPSTSQQIDITDAEFNQLQQQALTHDISVDEETGTVTLTPKEPS